MVFPVTCRTLFGAVLVLIGTADVEAQTDPFDLAQVPVLSLSAPIAIGGMDTRPGYFFDRIRGAGFLEDGSLVVADGGSREIRIYSSSGLLLTTLGRKGEGPGEFRSLNGLAVLPQDRVVLWDSQLRRATILEAGGRLISTGSAPAGFENPLGMALKFVGGFSSGGAVVRDGIPEMRMSETPAGLYPIPIILGFFDGEGEFITEILTLQGPITLFKNDGNRWGFDDRVFDRDIITVIRGEELLVANTDSLVIRRFQGQVEHDPLRGHRPVRTATEELIEAERTRTRPNVGGSPRGPAANAPAAVLEIMATMPERQRQRIERHNNMESHETMPAFKDLKVGQDGTIWMLDFPDPKTEISQWYALDDELRPTVRIPLPSSDRLLAIDDTRVVVVQKDEYDVETLLIYEINPGQIPD